MPGWSAMAKQAWVASRSKSRSNHIAGSLLGELADELGEDRVGAGVEAEPVGRVVAGELGRDPAPAASRRAPRPAPRVAAAARSGRLGAWLPPVRTSSVSA